LLGSSRSAEARVWRAASLGWQQRAGWGRAQPATGIPAATLHACFVADLLRAQLVTSSRSVVAASSIFKVRSDAAPLSSAQTDGGFRV